MTEILKISPVCDGWDVVCQIDEETTHVFHFVHDLIDYQYTIDQLAFQLQEIWNEDPDVEEGPLPG